MNISRFFGITNREAMRQVRLALGPDALIVSNRRINGGVEILATDPTSAARIEMQGDADALSARASPMKGSEAAQGMPGDVMQAIGALKGAMEGRMDELVWGSHLKRAPQALALFQTLMGFGFSTALLRAMLKRLPEHLGAASAFQWARHELVRNLPVLQSEDALWRPGLTLAVVGPTGVGKTTTLAKLAARAVRRFGHQHVVLVTTDTYRIGAHEQLKLYGDMLRVPVHVVQDAAELAQLARSAPTDSIVLIDNVGISQRDRYVAEQASMLSAVGRDVRRLLVLSAASHGDTLDEVARTYRNDGGTPLAGCIITKLDEAARLGAVLDTCIRYQLPVHYVSDGQKVPENLNFFSATDLLDRTFADASTTSALYAPSSADLAALIPSQPQAASGMGRAVAKAGRQRLLSSFLAGGAGTVSAADEQQLQYLFEYMDAQPACRQAFELWQAFRDGAQAVPENGALARHAYKAIQTELRREEQAGETLVLSHLEFGVGGRQAATRLRTSLAFGTASGMLGSPLQQVCSPGGWQSSNGFAGLEALGPSQAMLESIDWFQAQQSPFPVLHLFDRGNQALWLQLLQNSELAWGAICSAGTRLLHEDTLTTVGALARSSHYQPWWQESGKSSSPQRSVAGDMTFKPWVAAQDLSLSTRHTAAPGLRLHHVRLQEDGATAKAEVVSVLAPACVAADALIQAVAMRQAQRWVSRAVPVFWGLFPQVGPDSSQLARAQLSTAMGVAAWQLLSGEQSGPARKALGMAQGKTAPVSQVSESLLRLFTAKALMN